MKIRVKEKFLFYNVVPGEDNTMKIAVFYENIKDGVQAKGITMREALTNLKSVGMDLLYISGGSIRAEWNTLKPLLDELNIGIEGVYDFCDFTHHMPEDFPPAATVAEVIDEALMVGANNVLIVPGMVSDEKGMKVSMEDFDGKEAPYCTIAGLKEFMDKIPGLYCSFDTGNFVMYHENEYDALKVFEERLCTIHLKDRSNTSVYPNDKYKVCADGQKIYPSPVGYGTMQIKKILDDVISHGYTGNVIVELFDCDFEHVLEAAEKSVAWIKQIYENK